MARRRRESHDQRSLKRKTNGSSHGLSMRTKAPCTATSTARAALDLVWASRHKLARSVPPRKRVPVTRLHVALLWLAAVLGLVAVLSWAVVAAAHVDDAYEVDHVAGSWMALAKYLDAGKLYPPLEQDGRYGGTRYMPVQVVLHGGLAKVTGEYLVSGKLLVYGLFAILLAVLVVVLRRRGCPAPLALGLAGGVLASPAGLYDATAIRGDALPAALQLAAVALVAERRSSRASAAAGSLCALAFLSKTSAVWAPLAIVIWLARAERRRLTFFLGAGLGSLGAGLGVFNAVSGGRFFANVFGLLLGPGADLGGSPTKTLELLQSKGGPTWLLLPIAAFAVLLAVARSSLGVYELALVAASAVLVVVMTDPGADFNHLLDVEVLTVVAVGGLWARHRRGLLAPALALLLVWGLVASLWVDVRPQVHAAATDLFRGRTESRYALDPLPGRIRAGQSLLSEDPTLPVSLGRLPVVLDPFMLLRVLRRHPRLRSGLVGRIERREFDLVVLIVPLDPRAARWQTLHFGPAIAAAIAGSYRFSAQAGRYFVYVPKAAASSTSSSERYNASTA